MFLFLSDYIDLLLCTGYLLLLISVFVLISVVKYHIKRVEQLELQRDYWRQQALSEKHRDEEN